jgi:hypothetical protein
MQVKLEVEANEQGSWWKKLICTRAGIEPTVSRLFVKL